jgi:hypothetical protein
VIIEPHPNVLKEANAFADAVNAAAEAAGSAVPVAEVLAGTWQEALPTLAPGSLDSLFYDTHDEGVLEFLQVARRAAHLLAAPPELALGASATAALPSAAAACTAAAAAAAEANAGAAAAEAAAAAALAAEGVAEEGAAGTSIRSGGGSGDNTRGLFAYWNGMEFHNAFRHAAYCEASRRHLCGTGYAQVRTMGAFACALASLLQSL